MPVKRSHQKSRSGCQTCKRRRVKCDETRPVCCNCDKRSIDCIYAPHSASEEAHRSSEPFRPSPLSSTSAAAPSHTTPASYSDAGPTNPDDPDDPDEAFFSRESAARRKLELELMYTFTTSTAASLPSSITLAGWRTEGPRIALAHEPLLCAIFSLAALHLSKLRPCVSIYPAARRWYLRHAIHLHRATLNSLSEHNFERIYLATSLICYATFFSIGEDEDATADAESAFLMPMLWFKMSGGLRSVWESCLPWIWHSEIIMASVKSAEYLIKPEMVVNEENRRVLPGLSEWRREEEAMTAEEEAMTAEEEAAYDANACYIGKAFADAKGGVESHTLLVRRLQVFPPWSKPVFSQLVDERRPRALLMLAHLYAFVVALDVDEWWYLGLSMALEKQVRLIKERLPPAWKEAMSLPMRLVDRKVRVADAV